MTSRFLFALLPLMVAACVPQPKAPPPAPAAPPPAPASPAAPPPALASDWRDWPITPGNWRYAASPNSPTASFGTGTSLFTLRCDRAAGQVALVRADAAGAQSMTIRTTSTQRTLPVQPGTSGVEARLGTRDPLLDAMGFSRGRFIVETPPAAPLAVPAWPEILRVIEDCRG